MPSRITGVIRSLGRVLALSTQLLGWPLLAVAAAARSERRRPGALLELLDTWSLHLLAPWPLLGLVALARRSPAIGLLAGLGSIQAVQVARLTIGRGPRSGPVHGARLRVLTANVLATNLDAAGLVALIAREQPDLVALQEVRPRFGAELSKLLSPLLPHAEVMPDYRYSGAALFSRWPLDGLEHFTLSDGGHFCQRVCLTVDGRPLQLFNIHLETPYEVYGRPGGWLPFGIRRREDSARDAEIERLLDLVEKLEEPLIVVGDFNTSAGSRAHRRLLRALRDAHQEAGRGLGLTFPQSVSIHGLVSPLPLLRIDYAFFRGQLRPLITRTLDQPGSDHRAVVADFELGASPAA